MKQPTRLLLPIATLLLTACGGTPTESDEGLPAVELAAVLSGSEVLQRDILLKDEDGREHPATIFFTLAAADKARHFSEMAVAIPRSEAFAAARKPVEPYESKDHATIVETVQEASGPRFFVRIDPGPRGERYAWRAPVSFLVVEDSASLQAEGLEGTASTAGSTESWSIWGDCNGDEKDLVASGCTDLAHAYGNTNYANHAGDIELWLDGVYEDGDAVGAGAEPFSVSSAAGVGGSSWSVYAEANTCGGWPVPNQVIASGTFSCSD